jgi:hypothetical protein
VLPLAISAWGLPSRAMKGQSRRSAFALPFGELTFPVLGGVEVVDNVNLFPHDFVNRECGRDLGVRV